MNAGGLSEETYRAVMIEAGNFNHDLTLQFGLLQGECKGEEKFIAKYLNLIEEMKLYNEMNLDDMFLKIH